MPFLSVTLSNELFESARDKLLREASALVAQTLGKSEAAVGVSIRHAAMIVGGESGPAALVELRSVGGLDANVNSILSKKLCDLLARGADVPPDRVHIHFMDVRRADWGWNRKTL